MFAFFTVFYRHIIFARSANFPSKRKMVAIIGTLSSLTGAAVAATLAFSSGRNIVQTWQACDTNNIINSRSRNLIDFSKGTVEEQVNVIKTLSRKELLQVFLHESHPPNSMMDLDGDWDGVLLENNGLVMVCTL